jgi:hypothetical protein
MPILFEGARPIEWAFTFPEIARVGFHFTGSSTALLTGSIDVSGPSFLHF